MESFERIHLDLSKQPGKCRIAETGLGWKPSGGGDTFTLDASNISGAQWSRAARGYELKILSPTSGVIQLDGFDQEVRAAVFKARARLTFIGLRSRHQSIQTLLRNQPRKQRTRSSRLELGQSRVRESGARVQRAEQTSVRNTVFRDLEHESCGEERGGR
jgi:hypothetical protein